MLMVLRKEDTFSVTCMICRIKVVRRNLYQSAVFRTLQVLLYVEAKQLDVSPTLIVKVSSCEKSLLSFSS